MIAIVVNPASGQGHERDLVVERVCSRIGQTCRVVKTTGPGDVVRAVREAAAARPDALVIVGGDGTIGELCHAYRGMDDRPPVVLAPAGRGNSLYKAIMSDAPWEEYVQRALDRPYVRSVDAGLVVDRDHTFVLGFTLGYLHDAVAAARHIPGLRGRTLYTAAGAWAAARPRPFRVEVEVDGRPVYAGRSVMTAVGNAPFRGGRLHLFPVSDMTDGRLDVVVVEDVGPRRFAEILRAAGHGTHVDLPEVHAFAGAEIRLRTSDPMRAELDGTLYPYDGDSVTLRCLPGFLPVAFPLWNWDDVRPADSVPTTPGEA